MDRDIIALGRYHVRSQTTAIQALDIKLVGERTGQPG
jgi:hypothetical protein